MKNKLFPALGLALALGLGGPAAALEVVVKGVESMEDFHRWAQQKPVPRGTFPTVTTIAPGKKVNLPIVVSGFGGGSRAPLDLVADMEIVDPKGKTATLRRCCRYALADRSGVVTAILGNTVSFELDPGDPPGVYTVRAIVSDGASRATAVERFRYGAAEGKPPAKAPAAASPPRANRGADLRHCLSLPTPAEVARCSEGR